MDTPLRWESKWLPFSLLLCCDSADDSADDSANDSANFALNSFLGSHLPRNCPELTSSDPYPPNPNPGVCRLKLFFLVPRRISEEIPRLNSSLAEAFGLEELGSCFGAIPWRISPPFC
ncbi:hypothetical protein LF1_46650 [Rubripirellula obstinata]|uniref:Uncharacterized protein n=1 Tax=Rubripirellula obstinata TaxID=406547 RepID=A0A5B1CSB5_9BACT|nr:hypothetical protein LF1_46650 [Rubripirellula obstinata]